MPKVSTKIEYKTNLSITEAHEAVQTLAKTLKTEEVPLIQAHGRTLAADIASLVDHPNCDNSALDGFACRKEDTVMATEDNLVSLKIVADLPAGQVFENVLATNEAVAVYTGSPLPKGADAIIAIENVEVAGEIVWLKKSARSQNIRHFAQDTKKGEIYLKKGQLLTAAAIGVAASMGHDKLPVVKIPKIGVLATGNEVIEPGKPLLAGQVYNANSYSIASLVKQMGGEPVMLPRATDNLEELKDTISQYSNLIDLLITSGGVSVGNYDFVRKLIFNEGKVHFWKIVMSPGGPTLFGEWQDLPIFGLPGNPVSSMVAFFLVAQAWLYSSLGATEALSYYLRLKAKAKSPFKGVSFKETFRRGNFELDLQTNTYSVTSTGNQNSGVLTSMLGNCLVIVPPYSNIQVGEWVEIILLPKF